jgi:hypothetical protein
MPKKEGKNAFLCGKVVTLQQSWANNGKDSAIG